MIRHLLLLIALGIASPLLAQRQYSSDNLFAQVQQVDVKNAPPRVMGFYEQGWDEGAGAGVRGSGRIGWFFAGFGNVPLMWLPWLVEPRRPAKPPIQAEEEFNNGYRSGYRAGWKNAHKTFYIAGTIVESAIITGILLAQD